MRDDIRGGQRRKGNREIYIAHKNNKNRSYKNYLGFSSPKKEI